MKKLAIYGLFGALSLAGLAPSAFAQHSLEDSGGPTSTVTKAEIDDLKKLSTNLKNDINRALEEIKSKRDPSETKKILVDRMRNIEESAGSRMNNMLLKESIGSGLSLNNLIQEMTIKQGLSRTPPGIVRQQVRILKHSLEKARDYYQKDQDFLEARVNGTERKTQWVYFGKELSDFIIKMSDGVLSAPASYGMVRWALGILERKLLDDKNRPAFADAIKHLDQDLNSTINPMPDLMHDRTMKISDAGYVAKTRQLKLTARFANQDLAFELKEMGLPQK